MDLHRNLADQLYKIIKQRIINLTLPPGTRLSIQEIATEFKVSQSPVRDALRKLSEESIVKNPSSGGYRVIKPSIKHVNNIYELRELLEVYAIDKAIDNMDMEKLGELKHKIAAQNYDYLTLDIQLHWEIIIKGTKNEELKNFYSQLSDFVKMCHHICQSQSGRRKDATREHLRLIDALISRKIGTAKKLLRKHIRNSKKAVIEVLQSCGKSEKIESPARDNRVPPKP